MYFFSALNNSFKFMSEEEAQREEATWQNEYSTPQKLACSQ